MSGKLISLRFFCTKIRNNEKMNKIAIVTGGSGGLGRDICLALGSKGCQVIVNYNSNIKSAMEIVEEINTKWGTIGAEAIAIQADCSNPEAVKSLFQQVTEKYGQIDILVNNAGIKQDKLAISMSSPEFISVLSTNINSTFYCSQLALSLMIRRRTGGRIINIASVVGQIGNIGQVNYSTAKGGIIAMTRALAKEYGSRNICINAVCPGYIDSGMMRTSERERGREAEGGQSSQGEKDKEKEKEKLEQIRQSIPLKRLGKSEEVASLVTFLALDVAGGYMTGHCINIDGGIGIGAT